MKRFLLLMLFLSALSFNVLASEMPLVVDEADLLTETEELTLLYELEAIRETEDMDVVVVTVDSVGYATAEEFADDFYDNNGYSVDGILLLVSMEYRDWYISTSGFGITAFTDAGLEYIADEVLYYLSDGDYYNAFMVFADYSSRFISQAKTGEPYDIDNMPQEPFDVFFTAVFSFGIAFIIALISTAVMKGQLNSVRTQTSADDYVKSGSLNIKNSNEIFLYRNVTRTVKETNNSSSGGGSSTHRSSSGRMHGGRGGKF